VGSPRHTPKRPRNSGGPGRLFHDQGNGGEPEAVLGHAGRQGWPGCPFRASRDEQVGGWLSRLLTATAPLSAEWMIGPDHPRTVLLSDAAVLRCTEGVIRKAVCGEGGVILGRAAAIVLRDHPGAFHVRLDGDPDRRVRQAMALQGMSNRDAREAMDRNDRARTAYVRHFYGADAASPRHYDLVIDSTRIPIEACTEMIVSAAKSCSGKKG